MQSLVDTLGHLRLSVSWALRGRIWVGFVRHVDEKFTISASNNLNWFNLLTALLSAGFGGTLATICAPFVAFGLEKRKIIFNARRVLIFDIRAMASKEFDRFTFRRSPEFFQIKLYLSQNTLEAILQPQNYLHIDGGSGEINRHVEPLLLDDLARIEIKWRLI